MKPGRVCLIGGGGYVGTTLARRLLDEGRTVTVVDTFWFGDHLGTHPRLHKIEADIRRDGWVKEALTDVDTVVVLACLSNDPMADLDPELTRAVNLDALQRVILDAKAHGARRLIYASSSSVYGIQDVPRVVESTPLKPITLYSRYKGEIEDFLNAHVDDGFVGVSVRSATVCGYSPRMRLDLLLNLFCWLALRQGAITIEGGSQIRPLIHMQDVVDFYVRLLGAEARLVQGEAYNVSSGNYTVQQVADMVSAYTGCALTYTGVVDARSYPLDAEKAERVLGFKTRRTIDDAMVEVCEAIHAGRIDGTSANFNLRRYRELVGAL